MTIRSIPPGSVALFVLLGCAPVAHLRPPSALAWGDRRFEAGAAVAHVTARPYVDEPSANVGQAWATVRAAPWLNLSAVSAFDSDAAAGGLAALGRFVHSDRVVAAAEVEGGFAWVGASLSAAGRIVGDAWVYTAPRVSNWGSSVSVGFPLGVSATVYEGFFLRAEGQVSWVDFAYYNRRFHAAGGAGYSW